MKTLILFFSLLLIVQAEITLDSSGLNSSIKKTTDNAYRHIQERKKRAAEERERQVKAASLRTNHYSESDLKNMCLGVSGKYPDFCYAIQSNDLKNTYIGMTKYKDNCYAINNKDMKNFCLGASREYPDFCYAIKNKDLKNACIGICKYSNNCYAVQNANLKSMCIGIAIHSDNCYGIQ
jgi:polynucleotide 5'-kinase involved in rRNA processing